MKIPGLEQGVALVAANPRAALALIVGMVLAIIFYFLIWPRLKKKGFSSGGTTDVAKKDDADADVQKLISEINAV
jgi:hypothetical protein